MKKPCTLLPGNVSPFSGIGDVIGPRGGYRGQVTLEKGNRVPPTDIPGCTIVPAVRADNQRGRGKC